jgi:uncharacterized protein involved in exopolysaccharide biosynthesis/Mrp family chromosome partitioning ATPase
VLAGATLATVAAFALTAMIQPRVYRSTCSVLFPEGVPAPSFSERVLDLGLQQQYLQSLFTDERLIMRARADPELSKWKAGEPGIEALHEQSLRFAFDSLTVTAAPGGKVYHVSCEAHDPELAAAVANAVTGKLIDLDAGRQRSGDAAKVASLREALGRLRTAMAAAEDEVRAAMRTGTAVSKEDRTRWLTRLSQSDENVSKATAARISAQARYETFLNSPESAPAEYSDREFSRASRNDLAQLRQQLAAAESAFTLEHYKVKQLHAELEAASKVATDRDKIIVDLVRDEYVAAARREQAFSREHLSTLAGAAQAWDPALSNDAALRLQQARTLYDSLSADLEAAEAREDPPQNYIFDRAVPATTPVRPNFVLTAPLWLVMGMLLCSLAVLMRESSRRTKFGLHPSGVSLRTLELARITNNFKHSELVHRCSAVADEFRNLRQSILIWEESLGATHGGGRRRGTSLAITGPSVAVPVTAVACNLAISLANSGRHVLLVDVNRERPGVHDLLAPIDSAPMMPIFWGTAPEPLNDAPRATEIPGLFVLGADGHGGSALFTEALAASFLVEACARFDFVIFDIPPVSCTDARIWTHACDGAVLVVEAGATTNDLAGALLSLGRSGARFAGAVVHSMGTASGPGRMKRRQTAAASKDARS